MNLEQVNAIMIWEDGIPHSFGENRMAPPSELGDENYHTTSFLMQVYPSEWFQETGYPYQTNQSFGRQMGDLSAYGFTILCNASSKITNQEDYYCFMINTPINISENTRNYLSSIYPELKELIETHHAFFQGTAYEENGDYAWATQAFDLDEFYDKLGLQKGIKHQK